MNELAQALARVRNKVCTYVVFYSPSAIGSHWEDTDLRREAAAIPGVKILSDRDGIEARRFGAETSGHTFLFSPDGRLLFNGGITASRGHAGGNAGESAIVSLIDNHPSERPQTFVFGCAIKDPPKQAKGPLCSR
jgi:predicted amidohydrolase